MLNKWSLVIIYFCLNGEVVMTTVCVCFGEVGGLTPTMAALFQSDDLRCYIDTLLILFFLLMSDLRFLCLLKNQGENYLIAFESLLMPTSCVL